MFLFERAIAAKGKNRESRPVGILRQQNDRKANLPTKNLTCQTVGFIFVGKQHQLLFILILCPFCATKTYVNTVGPPNFP